MTKHKNPKKLKCKHKFSNKEKEKDDHELKYTCPYCKHNFTQVVGTYSSGNSNISSKVACPVCGNFLKTNSGR